MTTDVNTPSRFSALSAHYQAAQSKTSFTFAGQEKTVDGGRWSAMRNHLIDSANAEAAKPKTTHHPRSIRFVG